jgi:MraZ protein
MLSGVTHLSLDLKNRLAIPARYREELLLSKLTVTLESANYLILYPESNWLDVREKVQNLPSGSHPLVKSYQRLILGYAETVELDKAGRILVPQALKGMVKLDKEVVLVGMGNRFELWDKQAWQQETEKALQTSQDELAKLLNGFTL